MAHIICLQMKHVILVPSCRKKFSDKLVHVPGQFQRNYSSTNAKIIMDCFFAHFCVEFSQVVLFVTCKETSWQFCLKVIVECIVVLTVFLDILLQEIKWGKQQLNVVFNLDLKRSTFAIRKCILSKLTNFIQVSIF